MRRFQGSRYAAMLGLAGAAALTACGGGSDGHHANAGHSRGGHVGHRRHGGQGPDGQGRRRGSCRQCRWQHQPCRRGQRPGPAPAGGLRDALDAGARQHGQHHRQRQRASNKYTLDMAFVGALTAPGRTTLEISLGNTWFNDRLEAPYQSPPAAGGAGLLLATELAWQGERAALSLALFDGGWLHWSALPRQRMSLDNRPSAWTPTAFWFART